MSTHVVEQVVCRACDATLDVGDNFCRHCGVPTAGCASAAESLVITQPRNQPLDSPWVVLGLLFFVLGPFALPLLYKSRAFPVSVKILLTIVVLVIAVVAVWVTLHFLGQILAPLKEAWRQYQSGTIMSS